MLTDYHVHLRPDEPGTTAADYFTVANAARYRQAADDARIDRLGISEHVYRFVAALEVWDHPFWRQQARDDLDAYCAFVAGQDLDLGIEMDFVPGREEQTRALLDARPFDYVVGSVHFLGDHSLDMAEFDVWESADDPDEVWRRYFQTLADAARSGLFDILAHPDLVKVWGRSRPGYSGELRELYEPAVTAIAESGVAVEVSTAGLRKATAELYPSRPLLELLVDAGVPVALSSDAHRPEHLGYAYEQAVAALVSLGVDELATFRGRERTMEPLG